METPEDKTTPTGPAMDERWMHWHAKRRKFRFLIPFFVLAAIAVMGTVVMLLWNHIMPTIWPTIGLLTWWKAVGLLVLCRILFGGFHKRRGGPDGPNWKQWGGGPMGGPGESMRDRLREKWKGMSDEERQRMREELRRRCGDRFRSRSRRWIEVLPEPVRLQHHGTLHALQTSLLEARTGRRSRRSSALLLPLPAADAGLRVPHRPHAPLGVRLRPAEASRLRHALERDERRGTPAVPRTSRAPLRPPVVRAQRHEHTQHA